MTDTEIIIRLLEQHKSKFIEYIPPVKVRNNVTDFALKHLKVVDLFKLRDKFEGQQYYDMIQKRIFSLAAVEKVKNISFLPSDFRTLTNNDYILDTLTIPKGFIVRTFTFDKLPEIPFTSLPVCLVFMRNFKSYNVIGEIDPMKIIKDSNIKQIVVRDFSSITFYDKD